MKIAQIFCAIHIIWFIWWLTTVISFSSDSVVISWLKLSNPRKIPQLVKAIILASPGSSGELILISSKMSLMKFHWFENFLNLFNYELKWIGYAKFINLQCSSMSFSGYLWHPLGLLIRTCTSFKEPPKLISFIKGKSTKKIDIMKLLYLNGMEYKVLIHFCHNLVFLLNVLPKYFIKRFEKVVEEIQL